MIKNYRRSELVEIFSFKNAGSLSLSLSLSQETVQERWESVYHIREVNISFFLEDGTMKVVEPPVSNSGLEQGLTVHLFCVIFLSSFYQQQDTRHVFYLLLLNSLIFFSAFLHFVLLSD